MKSHALTTRLQQMPFFTSLHRSLPSLDSSAIHIFISEIFILNF